MSSALAMHLQQLIQHSPASQVGIAARPVWGDQRLLMDADLEFHPASTIKICVMMEAFLQARVGAVSLDDTLPLDNRFLSLADGSPYSLVADDDSEKGLYDCTGQAFSIRELIHRMITASSNLATNTLLQRFPPQQVNRLMETMGVQGITVRRGMEDKKAYQRGLNNSATARGLMELLLRLARHEVVSPQDSIEMIEILSRPQLSEAIAVELPRDVLVAHKTGSAADYFHDVGIIHPPGRQPVVLAILTKGYAEFEEQKANAFIALLAHSIYRAWCSD